MTQYARYPSGSVSVSSVGQGAPNTVANGWPVIVTDGTRSAAVTAGSAVKVDGSGVTQPVSAAALPLPSGAATAAKQPALGTAGSASADVISVQGIASMTALKVDGSGVTQPVSAAALPLPSGAATAAKQPALGTAGSASADVISVQGIASMTALKVDGSGVTQPVSGTVTANAGTGTFATSAAQSGTWTVQPGNTANTTAWLTDQNVAAATFQAEGSVVFSSLTTSFATVFTTAGAMKLLQLRNSMNQQVIVSLDGGTTTHYVLEPGDCVELALKSLGMKVATSTAIQAKYSGTAPTSGSFRVNGAY